MNIPFGPLHDDTLPLLTTSQKVDVTTVYFCEVHNACLLKADIYIKGLTRTPRCRKHGNVVTNITNSPLARSYLAIVHPYPKE